MVGLAAADAAGPAADLEVVQGPIEGLHLANPVVGLQVLHLPGFPQATVEGLHTSWAHAGLGDVQLETKPLHQSLGVLIGLGGQVTGIHPNHGNLAIQLADQVQGHRGLNAKARGEGKAVTEGLQSPTHALQRTQRPQLLTGLLRIEAGCGGGGRRGHRTIFQCGGRWLGFALVFFSTVCRAPIRG